MKYLNTIDWWSLLKEIVLPHMGTLIFYIVIFVIIGFICGVIYNLILWRKNIYTRSPKYYNWAVKFYIVISMCVFIYFSIHLAFLFAAKTIIRKEENRLVSQIYEKAALMTFETPEARNQLIKKIQDGTITVQQGTTKTATALSNYVASKNIGINAIDNGKNKFASYVVNRYKEDIYSASLYGMLLAAGRGHIKVDELSYAELKAIVAKLNTLDPKKIEENIKIKLTEKVDELVSSQINGLIKTTLLFFFLLLSVPIIEFYIYSWWWKNRMKNELLRNNAQSEKNGFNGAL